MPRAWYCTWGNILQSPLQSCVIQMSPIELHIVSASASYRATSAHEPRPDQVPAPPLSRLAPDRGELRGKVLVCGLPSAQCVVVSHSTDH